MYIIDYIICIIDFYTVFLKHVHGPLSTLLWPPSHSLVAPLALSCGPLRTLLWPLETPCIVLEERKQHVSAVLLQQPVGRACEREFSQNDLSAYVVFSA